MPDISMCRNTGCGLRDKCYRYRATPNPHRQAYQNFKPDSDNHCDHFILLIESPEPAGVPVGSAPGDREGDTLTRQD